ncbi:MAG: AsmA family protein [Victivallales bacterium]|jgi:hypothetical protein
MNPKSKKRLKKILMVSFVSVLVLITLAYLFLGFIVKNAVETVVPKITGTPVKMESFSFSAVTGKVKIKNFVIGNPDGFKTEHAFMLGSLAIDIEMGTLLSKKIVIDEIRIEGTQIVYEQGLTTSNLGELRSNIDKFVKKDKKEEKAEAQQKTGGGKKIQINNFYFNNASVSLSAVLLQGQKATMPIPDIHLKDMGKEEKGASIGEVADEIFTAIYASIGKVAGSGTEVLKGIGNESWNQVKGIFK